MVLLGRKLLHQDQETQCPQPHSILVAHLGFDSHLFMLCFGLSLVLFIEAGFIQPRLASYLLRS